MQNLLYDYGSQTNWKDVYVKYREGYYSPVADFHEHDYYEINFILSGNVKILLANQVEEGTQNRIVLTKPRTPHFVSCKPDTLYSRLYLVFTEEFIEDYVPEWKQLLRLFGEKGRIITVSPEQKEFCKLLIKRIQEEAKPFRQRILILYLLSYISEFAEDDDINLVSIPAYIIESLTFIDEHYAEKITAAELAQKLHIGRTTLMTAFKKYTGSTLNNYLIHCRLKKAIQLLNEGKTEQEAAEICGLSDSSGLIRCFKRSFGMTPKQYISSENTSHSTTVNSKAPTEK